MSGDGSAPAPARSPVEAPAKALQLVIALGRADLAAEGRVAQPTWAMIDDLLELMIANLPESTPRRG